MKKKTNSRSSGIKHSSSTGSKRRNVSLYSNLARNRRSKKDIAARKRAEYLATLPKQPLKRLIYRLHPKRVIHYWFSKDGLKMALKIVGGGILALALLIGGLFAYYRKDLDAIQPGQIDKRVQSTVTRYLDRNGKLLWEDKGTGNYTLVVKSDQISNYVKEATVAIEDKNFYNHGGISITGILRAGIADLSGQPVQGGSTLTQQLVKQVFFASQANQRGLSGIPRKIKEMILAVEVEGIYNKDQILTMYLNESPYGGRRNGIESAAETYFHKHAKDLTLAESALLAAIPNNPSIYDPYISAGNQALIDRQHKVLDDMVQMHDITQAQADQAKAVPILNDIFPPENSSADKLAPHFVDMVKQQLDQELGPAVMGQGGLTVTTTLDYTMQQYLEGAVNDMFDAKLGTNLCGRIGCPAYSGFRNAAGALEDTQTGQLLALVGSKGYDTPGYGQDNAATAYIQPGSSIKPLVYAQLFQKQPDGKPNWGAGSILSDVKTTFGGDYTPNNADDAFLGNITIREALDRSRNIPAIKAMQIAGLQPTWNTIHAMGDTGYCTRSGEVDAGLSSAIGSCGVKLVNHVNAMASLGRMGAYIPQSTILSVTNSSGQTLLKYTPATPKQVVDPQAAYIVNDILSDSNMRAKLLTHLPSHNIDATGLRVAIKTGTSDISIGGKPYSKDLWTIGYTPSLSMAVWTGNPDNTPLTVGRGYSIIPMYIVDQVIVQATQRYKDEGKLGPAFWTKPAGIQTINGDIYPSYFNKSNAPTNETMQFDRVSKMKATACTPPAAIDQQNVLKILDPSTGKATYTAPAGYDPNSNDNVHSCSDTKPTVTLSVSGTTATVDYTQGTFPLQTLQVSVDGNVVSNQTISGNGQTTVQLSIDKTTQHTIVATVTDSGYYQASGQATVSGGKN